MTEPTFTRFGTGPLYWTDPADRVAAFLASSATGLGTAPRLTRTWQDTGGRYVFLGAPAADPEAFLTALSAWTELYAPQRPPKFLWVMDPAASPTEWVTSVLGSRAAADGTWLAAGAAFPLAGYELAVNGGGSITPALTDAGWGFTVAAGDARPAVTLWSPTDSFPARPGPALLSMDTGHTGTWRFEIDTPAGSGDAFARLGAGIRFFTPGDDDHVHGVHFAALGQPNDAGLTFYAQIDPLRPLDNERTGLGLTSWSLDSAPPVLPSGYATVLGHGVSLRPLAAGATTAAPARLVFGTAPYFPGTLANPDYYLIPAGPFALDAGPDGGRVVCGTSGLEYIRVPAGGCTVVFEPGHNAYAPGDAATAPAEGGDRAEGEGGDGAGAEGEGGPLTPLGTTAWVRVEPPADGNGVTYYSQPEDAPLHAGGIGSPAEAGGPDLLGYREVPAADAAGAVFPMAPFRGLAPGTAVEALRIERSALAPLRRALLLPAGPRPPSLDAVETVALTPQGLSVGLAPDSTWAWLGIGHSGGQSDDASVPDLRFTTVSGPFRQAMQTNDLFLVLGDPETFHTCGSVPYRLTTESLRVIATIPQDDGGVRPEVLGSISAIADLEYLTRTAFTEALLAARSDVTEDEKRVFLRFAGQMTPVVGGWPFRLSPDNWRPSTYLIMKFALGRSIAEMVADTSVWAWPQAASRTGKPSDAQAAISAVIDSSLDVPEGSPYADFAAIVRDPRWTGILVLSAEVPLDQLPPELQVLGAGIDPAAFAAHHLAIPVTPFRLTGGRPVFERSSMAGLIDYENAQDQYFTEDTAFAFRVLRLTVGVRNSLVTTFSSRVELLVNRLFGTATRLQPTTHGNNVFIDGALQRQQLPNGESHDTFAFSMAGQDSTFALGGPVLQSVELVSARLLTTKAASPPDDPFVEAVFQMSGTLRFSEPEGFDPFCWGPGTAGDGGLRFAGLAVGMSFALGDPVRTTVFTLRDADLTFDAANSTARSASLVSRFPLRLAGLITTADPLLSPGEAPPARSPADLGYVSTTAPLDQFPLTQPWYGLDYTLDLGTLGALTGSKALTVRVLAAWSPGGPDSDPGLYLGVKLPGADGLLGVSLPLQGVVTMGFRSVEFLVDEPPGAPRTYTLRLRDFALRLLGLAFPPGHNDVILFGDPDRSGPSKLGWYLAYAADSDPRRPAPPPTHAETARRRPVLRRGKEGGRR